MKSDILIFNKTIHKILKLLALYPLQGFYVTEIARKVSLSKAAVSLRLRKLYKENLVSAEKRGKEVYYKINIFSPIIKQYKILANIVFLEPLINKLKSSSRRIVLFGSVARGEDQFDSDIDLFIVSKEPMITRQIIGHIKLDRKIQSIIKTASELTEFESKNKEFYEQAKAGITLWEEKDDH